MKRIIFSSVCAVALFSVNAKANVWDLEIEKLDSSITTEIAKATNALGAKGALFETVKTEYLNLNKEQAKVAVKNLLVANGLGDTKISSDFDTALANRSDILAALKNTVGKYAIKLSDIKDSFNTTADAVANGIAAQQRKYDNAVKALNIEVAKLKDDDKGKNKTSYENAVKELEKLMLEMDKYNKAIGAYIYYNDYKTNFIGSSNKDDYTITATATLVKSSKLGADKLYADNKSLYNTYYQMKANLGEKSDDKTVTTTLRGKLAEAQYNFDEQVKKIGNPEDEASPFNTSSLYAQYNDKVKTALGDKVEDLEKFNFTIVSAGKFAVTDIEANAKTQTSLNGLLAVYEKAKSLLENGDDSNLDATLYTGGALTAAGNTAITTLDNKIKVLTSMINQFTDTGKLPTTPQVSSAPVIPDTELTAGITANTDAANTFKTTTLKNALDEIKKGAGTTLFDLLEKADKAVADQEAEIAKQEVNINIAEAKLAELEAVLAELKLLTPLGEEQVNAISDKLGVDYAGVANKEVKALASLIVKEDGSIITKAELNADKELSKKFQDTANAVAAKIIESNKDQVTQDALGALSVQINNMNKRLGEVRGLEGEAGIWARPFGGKYSTDSTSFSYFGFQGGVDKMTDIGNGSLLTGALVGFDRLSGDTKSNSYSFGAYVSYIDNGGFFADAVAKYVRTNHSRDGYDISGQNSFLLSLEGGYRANLGDNFYIEPSLELITGRVGDFKSTYNNTEITVNGFTPLVLKPQVFYGMNFSDFTFRVGGGAVVNTKSQEADIKINNIAFGYNASGSVNLKKNNYGFASIGGSYKFTDNLRLNLGVERSFGGKLTQDYELNATIRYTF